MDSINYKAEVYGNVPQVIQRLTEELKKEGFGVLTRIDLHEKFREKLGKTIPPAVILGACNPQLAYDAFQANPDVSSLLPCNAVVRDLGNGRCSVELARPSSLMKILGDEKLVGLAGDADQKLERCLKNLSAHQAAA